MAEAGISRDRARRHEALVLKLEALLREVRPLAARQPEGGVPAALRAAAEGLLYEAGRFAARQRREVLPAAALTLGALAVQLGQARAGLEAFELTHSYWSARHKAFVWRADPPLPIGRLRPELAGADREGETRSKQLRDELMRRFKIRVEEAWEDGYRAARTDTSPPAAEAGKHRGLGPVGD